MSSHPATPVKKITKTRGRISQLFKTSVESIGVILSPRKTHLVKKNKKTGAEKK